MHQFPITWSYGSWNNWKIEEGSTIAIVGGVHNFWNEIAWEERMHTIEKKFERELKQKLLTLASRAGHPDIVVVVPIAQMSNNYWIDFHGQKYYPKFKNFIWLDDFNLFYINQFSFSWYEFKWKYCYALCLSNICDKISTEVKDD